MTKLLLLDKDGTLVRPTHGEFVDAPWHQELLPNVKEKLQQMSDDGWAIAICSNQGGVAAGHKTLEQTFLEFRYVLELLPRVEEVFFCPNFEGSICWQTWGDCSKDKQILTVNSDEIWGGFRKPQPGMLRRAIELMNGEGVLFVGDRPEDEGAAKAAGVSFQWAKEFFEWTT